MTEKSNFTLLYPLRVRWAECDAQRIVFNGNYFLYFDVAMTEWMRTLGLGYDHADEFFTVHAEADFKASARFDDMLDIAMRCEKLGRSSVTMEAAVFRGEEVLTVGNMVYVHADPVNQSKAPLPEEFIAGVLAFEKTPPIQA